MRPPTSMITQADLFARACAALDTQRHENLPALALEGRDRKPTEAEAAGWSAVLSAAEGNLPAAQQAVQHALSLDAGNDALRQVRISVMRLVATRRVEEEKAAVRARRSVFGRLLRD